MQAISQRAFQRTMDSYHEHEHLADLFQVELDKKEIQRRERKEQDKLLKKKKSSKRSTQSRSQDRSCSQSQHSVQASRPPQPEIHSLHPQATPLGIGGAAGVKLEPASDVHRTGDYHGLKRARRNSDISSSEVSGYGDEELGHLGSTSKNASLQMVPSGSSSHAECNTIRSRSNELPTSSSPALPITPSPRVTPSDARERNEDDSEQRSGMGSANRSSTRPESLGSARSSTLSTPPGTTSSSILALAQDAATGRRKRKQAIPVNPSIVERMPGITLRIQRERQGSQLEVEILKNVDDYGWDPLSRQSPHSNLQALEDIQKVEEAIRSGRQPMTCNRRVSDWNRSLSSSLASLSWSTTNASSSTSLASMQDLIDARSLPLSWENFSTRECVVNKVTGKHDNDLQILEEVVQGTIARHQYSTLDLDEEQQRQRGRDHDVSPRTSTTPTRRHSDASTGASMAAAAAAAVSTGGRASKTSGTSASATTRTLPARATRSRTHVSKDGRGGKRGVALYAHDDLDEVLKHKRRKKLAERRRLGSKASSKDGTEDEEEYEYDDEDGTQMAEGRPALKVSKEMSEGDQEEDDDGDVIMSHRGKQQRKRQLSWTDKKIATQDAHKSAGKPLSEAADKRRVSRSGQEENESSTTSSSSDVDNSEDDYLNSKERLARSRRRTKVPKGSSSAADTADTSVKPKARRKSESDSRTPLRPHHIVTTANEPPLESTAGGRRTKKAWGRGRNSRKEDEVGTTTDDSSDDGGDLARDEDEDGEKGMPHGRSAHAAVATAKTHGTALHHSTSTALSHASRTRKLSSVVDTPPQTPLSTSCTAGITLDSGGRTRGRGRSFSGDSSLQGGDKNRFFDLALDTMNQKRRDALAKKRAAKVEAKGREQQEKADKERLEEAKAQKVEASNLPKSSKSLPGRVLRRTRMDGAAEEGSVDPDCTSCRMELTAVDKDAWKTAQEQGKIQLPKMWGVHAILCTLCRLQYLDHHSRCTACFYVPVKEEMATSGSSCIRCKAGTWLTETVRLPSVEPQL
ncbi:hypothetical protein BGZ70_003941 [Mortierella alpina]|uniref:Uncharacterized protein n=1 Tax=Mortierella alpina TaxID=64518 RepID=A0A9P6M546_MORAP|nr:hypothetical protein BGZ70_003941 [Mortierella alpina]